LTGENGTALCGDFRVVYGRMRFRDLLAHFPYGLEVCSQSIPKVAARLFLGIAHRGTSGE